MRFGARGAFRGPGCVCGPGVRLGGPGGVLGMPGGGGTCGMPSIYFFLFIFFYFSFGFCVQGSQVVKTKTTGREATDEG